jgi:hypothetical protein
MLSAVDDQMAQAGIANAHEGFVILDGTFHVEEGHFPE